MNKFILKSKYKPAGSQPDAIKKLTAGIKKGLLRQTLLGVTGSGKTFTAANVIENIQEPTLIISHNKTLAAQLTNEFREFFPDSAVEYFVSYYDYYQPESYLPTSDTYIEKEAQINEEIDRLRHAATQALMTRRDVIVVASVSAIYGLGSPEQYEDIVLHLKTGQKIRREELARQLIDMQFTRTNTDLERGFFRLRGQTLEIMPMSHELVYRFEIADKILRVETLDPVTRRIKAQINDAWFFPAKHYVASELLRTRALGTIRKELSVELAKFKKIGKVLEHERLKRRTNYDLEMIKNIGYCNGIENYSRHFENRQLGEPPFTLLDYFKKSSHNFLTIIDESHVTLPQIRGMYNGDKARKDTLVEHGFRLPSARDNRPLKSLEFNQKIGRVIYMSATPAAEELGVSQQIVEQIVRPTGLVDPQVIVRPITPSAKAWPANNQIMIDQDKQLSQIDDLLLRIKARIKKSERVLITTLTKRMAEDLTEYLEKKQVRVKYLHSEIKTIERIGIITELRQKKIDVIVGVNLLREGLDIPEVSLVAILDADKEGFLRNETSLIQTIGRASRNVNGQVALYADNITGSIRNALKETERRRKIQLAYNKKHNITPKTIEKNIRNILEEFGITRTRKPYEHKKHKIGETLKLDLAGDTRPKEEIINEKDEQMKKAAKELEFELAALLRDEIRELKRAQNN